MKASLSDVHPTGLMIRLGLFTATMIIVGNMIGSGVFKKAAPMAAELHSANLLLACWLIAGVVTLLGALSNAEVAGLIAEPGGYYPFFKRMYGPFFAFFYGWSCFVVIQTASVASIAYVFGESANSLFQFPRLSQSLEEWNLFGLFYPLDNFGVKAFTIGTIGALSLANYFGVRYGGLIANVSTALKLLGITAVVVLAFVFGDGASDLVFSRASAPGPSNNLGLFGAMFAASLGAFWAYDGWNNITSMAGEVRNPKRNIPLALTIGVTAVIVVYLLVNGAYLHTMSVDAMAGLVEQQNAIVAVESLRAGLGNGGATFIALLILLSTFGATNCQLMPHSRVYFAMARDGLFFRGVDRVSPRYHTPSAALLIQAVWASLLVMSGSFDQLTDMVIFASFIFYGATAFGVFVLRRTMPDAPRPYRVPGYPIVPAVFVLFCIALVAVTIYQRPRDAGIGLALMATALPMWWLWGRGTK